MWLKRGFLGPNISPQLLCCMSSCNNLHQSESESRLVPLSWRDEKLQEDSGDFLPSRYPLWATQYLQHCLSYAFVNEKSSLYGFAGHQISGNLNLSPNQLTPHFLIQSTCHIPQFCEIMLIAFIIFLRHYVKLILSRN